MINAAQPMTASFDFYDPSPESGSILRGAGARRERRPETTASGPGAGTPSKAKYSVDPSALAEGRRRVQQLLQRFPVYANLDLALLQKHFPRG